MHDGNSHGKMHPITGHLCVFHNSCLRLNNNLENISIYFHTEDDFFITRVRSFFDAFCTVC